MRPLTVTIAAPPLVRLFLLQGVLLGAGSMIFLADGTSAALSVLLGGSTALFANAWFARQVFRHRGAQRARQVVQGFYRGEAGKWLLSASLLTVLLVAESGLHAPIVLGSFACMHLVHTGCAGWVLRYSDHSALK